MLSRAVTAFIAALWAVGPFLIAASAQSPRAIGTIAGSFDVTLSGSSSYAIPIRLAPGAAGTEPKITIAYDSQSLGSSLGAGWSIVGLSTITRGPKSRFFDGEVDGVRLQETDALYLDGQRLVAISVSSSGPTRRIEYRKEIDDQSQIVQIGSDFGSSRFIVRTKGGLSILFDGSGGSLVRFGAGPALLQAASKILDTTGNYIQFEYNANGDGDYDIAKIMYSGRGKIDADGIFHSDRGGFASVQFEYESASRVVEAYVAGYALRKKTRLKSIRTIVTADLSRPTNLWSQVSRYAFEYAERPTTANRYVLTTVRQFGEDDSELTPTTFNYSEPLVGWQEAPFNLPIGIAFASRELLANAYRFIHFTDTPAKTPDLLFSAQINGKLESFAFQNRNGVWTKAPDGFKPPFPFTNIEGADLGAVFLDLNGDGRTDLVQSHKGKDGTIQQQAYLSDQNEFKAANGYNFPFNVSVEGKRISHILLGVLGRGRKSDLLFDDGTTRGFLENTGTGWNQIASLAPPVPLNHFAKLIDVDCDGIPELLAISTSPTPKWQVFRFSLAGWTEETRQAFLPTNLIPATIDPRALMEIRFSGYACNGIVASSSQAGGVRVSIVPTRTGWQSVPNKAPPFDLLSTEGTPANAVAVDLDKDGHIDVIAHQTVPASPPIKFAFRQTTTGWVRLGAAFEPPALGTVAVGASPSNAFVGDLNGDDYPEVVLPGGAVSDLGRVYRGTAAGFEEVPDYGPKVPFTRADQQDRGIRLIDLNADGLPDILFNREVADPKVDLLSKGAFINTGRGWQSVPGMSPPVPFAADYITGSPVQFVDVDGDGFIDMLYSNRRANGAITRAYYRNESCRLDDSEDVALCGPKDTRDPRLNRKWTIQEKSPGVPSDLAPPAAYPFAAENVGDLGVRFADIDGDARADMLAGSLLPKDQAGPNAPVEECNTVGGQEFCEPNRKLFRVAAFVNNGSSWSPAPNFDPRVPFVSQTNSAGERTADLYVQIIDVDGDTLPDIVAAFKHPYDPTKEIYEIWLNTGAGWRLDPTLKLPTLPNGSKFYLDEPRRDRRALAQWVDVNGDGLADIVFTKRQGGGNDSLTFISTGRGFVDGGNAWRIQTDAIADKDGDPSFRIIDVNGDGLPDVLYTRKVVGGGEEKGLYVNAGSGWTPADKTLVDKVPPFVDENGLDQGVRLFDVDGNGLLDVIQAFASGDANTVPQGPVLLNSGRRSDVLATINVGYGLKTHISYQTLLEANPSSITSQVGIAVPWEGVYVPGIPEAYPHISPVPASYVVRRVLAEDAPGRSVAVSYRYGDFRTHGPSMRSLGFGWRESYNEAQESQLLTRIELLQDVKFRNNIVRERSCWVAIDLIAQPATPRDRSRPSDVVLKNLCPGQIPSGLPWIRKLTETDNSWSLKEGVVGGSNGLPPRTIRQISLDRTKSLSFEIDGGTLTSQTDTFSYDDNPSILKRRLNVVETVSERSDGVSVRTKNDYGADDEERWYFGRLTRAIVTKTGDLIGPTSSERHQETRIATFEYSSHTGLLHSQTANADLDGRSVTTEYQHDQFGNVVSTDVVAPGEVPRTTRAEFDAFGRFAILETNAIGHRTKKVPHVTTGLPISVTNQNGLTALYDYDGFGRLTRETSPTGVSADTELLSLSEFGNTEATRDVSAAYAVRTSTEGLSAKVRLVDGKGRALRLIEEGFTADDTHSRPIYRDIKYDLLGRTAALTLPYEPGGPQLWAVIQYDRLGRIKEKRAPNGSATKNVYAARPGGGLITTISDALGRQTTLEANMGGQPVIVTDPMGGKIRYQYDAGTRLIKLIGPTGAVTHHSYDDRGQRAETIDPDLGRWRYNYDAFGRLVEQIDAKGQITTIEYDALDRVVRRAQQDSIANYEYDSAAHGIGKLASLRSSDGYREDFFYDGFGRQSRWSAAINRETFSTSTQLDRLGRVLRTSYPTGLSVDQHYDAKGFLTTVKDTRGTIDYWTLQATDEFGRTTAEMYGNGIPLVKTYEDSTGRPIRIVAGDVKARVLDLNLEYDLAGNLTRRVEKNGVQLGRIIDEKFEYDALDRLKGVLTSTGTRERYDFDAAGRITFKSGVGAFAYPQVSSGSDHDTAPFHGVIQTEFGKGRTRYSYDKNGNMVRMAGTSLEYDTDNKLKLAFNDEARWTRFDYSPNGSRYRQLLRSGRETAETIYIGGYERTTEHSGSLRDTLRGGHIRHRHYLSNSDGVFAAIELSGPYSTFDPGVTSGQSAIVRTTVNDAKTWYLFKDQLGSVLKVTDAQGRRAAAFWYDPWGRRTEIARDLARSTVKAGLPLTWNRGFTGHQHLHDFALIHMNGRVYNTNIASFTSVDVLNQALTDSQAGHGYAYARSNPLRFVDPTGYGWLSDRWEDLKRGAQGVVNAVGDAVRGVGHALNEAGKWLSENWRTVVIVAAVIVVTVVTGGAGATLGAAILSGMAAGATGGALGAALYGGSFEDILSGAIKGAVIGGLSAGAFHGVGSAFSGGSGAIGSSRSIGALVAHGGVGGVQSSAQGGNFWQGFAAAALTKGTSGVNFGSVSANAARAALVGGTVAAMSGGKFVNGAIVGAFSYMFNDAAHRARFVAAGAVVGGGLAVVGAGAATVVSAGGNLLAAPAEVGWGMAAGAVAGNALYDLIFNAPTLPEFDFLNPTQPPIGPSGTEWEWRGKAPVGGPGGAWVPPGGGESLHPDLGHGPPGPHWDYRDKSRPPGCKDFRCFPDGRVEPK